MSFGSRLHIAVAVSVVLTACTSGPPRLTTSQESVVHTAPSAPVAGQTLLFRRPDGGPLEGAVVDVGGKLIPVKNGRVVVPADVWQQATAGGTVLVAVPGYLPLKVAASADPNVPLALTSYSGSSALAPANAPIQAVAKGLALAFPGLGGDVRAGIGLYHLQGADQAAHQATLDALNTSFAKVKAGEHLAASALRLPAPVAAPASGAAAACPIAVLCDPVTSTLGLSVVVEGSLQPTTAYLTLDLDRMLNGWDGKAPEPWTTNPAAWSAAQIEEARAARRVLATFAAIDADPDAATWRAALEQGYGATLEGHVLHLAVGLPASTGTTSSVSSVGTDVLGVRLEVTLVTVPKGAVTPALEPVVAAVQTGSSVPSPTGAIQDPAQAALAAGQAVLKLPNGQAILPDNGPGMLSDFKSAGTGSVLSGLSTSLLANTVVDLQTGVTVAAQGKEDLVDVVTRANGAPIISNNGVSIVADNGASIIANHGGGVISDNGAGVIPVDPGNHNLQGGYVVSYPYAPFSPPQAKLQLLQVGVPTAPMVRTTVAGLREWLWPGMMKARAISIEGEALTDWTLTDNDGRFAIKLPPAMPLLFFLETQPLPGTAQQFFHEYSLAFAPRGRVSLVGVDSSTSFNSIPFIYLTTYVDQQTTSGQGTLAALESQLASLQSQQAAANAAGDSAGAAALQPQIDQLSARITALKALLAYLAQLERELDAGKNQFDVNSVFTFLKNPPAVSILTAPALGDSYDGLKAEAQAQSFTPVSYPLVTLP